MIKNNEESFRIIEGRYPIIISAPHSVRHLRINTIKPKETKTGIISKNIAKKCEIYGIYKTKGELNDANWDKDCKYKEKVRKIIDENNIKFLLDIHGMADFREEDICIGINYGENIYNRSDILEKMIKIFNKNGFENVTIDIPFNAKYEYCVSRYISKRCKIPTFQLEINGKYRKSNNEEYYKFINLENAIKEIVEHIKTSEIRDNFKKEEIL